MATKVSWTFPAKGDKGFDGRVLVCSDDMVVRTRGGRMASPVFLLTQDHQRVEKLQKGKYRITDTGEILTSDSPDAA